MFAIRTIRHAIEPASIYGRRTFRRTGKDGFMPQPHLFTNHCTSAMIPGADRNAFASLISVQQYCDDGTTFGHGIQPIANCIPVWYEVGGWPRDVGLFKNFYGEDGSTEGTNITSICLAFECPPCPNENHYLRWYGTYISLYFPPIVSTSTTSIWLPAVAEHIGSTAIWPWNNVSNPDTARDPYTGKGQCMPDNVKYTPFIAQNGTHMIAAMTYTESSFSISSLFGDMIGLPNQYTTSGIYGSSYIGPSRQANYTLLGNSSFMLQRDVWDRWEATQDFTATSLPVVIGSIGGMWTAFSGVLVGVFGTSMAFVFFGSKPIKLQSSIMQPWGTETASRCLDDHYFQPGKPIDAETRLRAVAAYLADYVIDTGELDLTLGRMPGEIKHCDSVTAYLADYVIDTEELDLTLGRMPGD